MAYQSMDVAPCPGALGAAIHGLDLSAGLSNLAFDEIHQAFWITRLSSFTNRIWTPISKSPSPGALAP